MKFRINCTGSQRTVGCGRSFVVEANAEFGPTKPKYAKVKVKLPAHTCKEWLQGDEHAFEQQEQVVETFVSADMVVA